MKNALFLLTSVLVLLANTMLAQNDDAFTFGLAFTPKTTYANFADSELAESYNRLGLNGQLIVHYQFNENFALVTGIKHSMDRFERLDYSIRFGSDFDPVTGVFDIKNSWLVNEITLHYLGVPIEGRYYLKNNGSKIYTKLGFEYLLKIGESQDAVIFENGTNELMFTGDIVDAPKDYGTKFSFGLGVDLPLRENTFLFLEPEVAYSATPVNEGIILASSATNAYRLFDIGLRTGIRF